MIDEETYNELKTVITELEKEKNQAEGALKQLKTNLKKEFKCSTLKAAKILLKKLKKEQLENEEKFNVEFRQFKKQYGPLLDSMANDDNRLHNKVPASLLNSSKRKKRS
jgi:hypothetical protein